MNPVIAKYADLPFSYSRVDCCQFVAEYLATSTGVNLADDFAYDDEAGALAHIARFGSLEALITSVLGPPYFGYKDGDVALIVQSNGNEVAGVFDRGRVVARVECGLVDLPPERARKVWRT